MKNDKGGEIEKMILQMFRIASKFARAEQNPIELDNGETLSTREIHTIAAVGQRRRMNVTQIGECFGVTKGAASQMVKRLVAKGYIAKRLSAHSNKEYEISLTEMGKDAFAAHERMHGAEFRELSAFIGKFGVEQIKVTAELLGAYERILEKRLEE